MITTDTTPKPPIKSGWRGEINGHVEHTEGAQIAVSEITLKLDHHAANNGGRQIVT